MDEMLKTLEPNQEDMENFLDFQKRWRDNDLTNDHPVMMKVKRLAKKLGSDPMRADDLEQSCLIALAESRYQGKAKLDTFIAKILLSKKIAAWRKSGGKRQTDLADEIRDEASEEFFKAVLARISSDKLMGQLLTNSRDLRSTVIRIITEAEHSIGRKRIAELASERLDRKVTRHQVEVVLDQLRDTLEGLDPWLLRERQPG